MPAFDVAIAGAGPAGTACAIQLARLGRSVLLLHQATGRPQPGEALPPAANRLLRELGVMEPFLAGGHLPCFGNQSAWGDDHLRSTDFLSAPDGHGWHIDRSRFDDMLRREAAAAGVALDRPGVPYQARWLVDCTGRAAVVARACGVRRRVYGTLTAFLALFELRHAAADPDCLTTIEAVETGWWYTARLPGGRRLSVYYTDAHSRTATLARDVSGYEILLARTRHVAPHLRAYRRIGVPIAMPAHSSGLEQLAGADWLAAGDAAIAHDPLSSLGISAAILSGMRAAKAVHRSLEGDQDAIPGYASWMRAGFQQYLHQCVAHYAAERRWPHSPFWRTRALTPEFHSQREPDTDPSAAPAGCAG
ncbi:MAG: NAD(P)/FAD-dependent oxidoreductase [Bryobacterales bacterium]|nr:NAD(P)/FAD-dependent oxidoreductase [Bryobacterales bacterium]